MVASPNAVVRSAVSARSVDDVPVEDLHTLPAYSADWSITDDEVAVYRPAANDWYAQIQQLGEHRAGGSVWLVTIRDANGSALYAITTHLLDDALPLAEKGVRVRHH
jgi:hypothetical protein